MHQDRAALTNSRTGNDAAPSHRLHAADNHTHAHTHTHTHAHADEHHDDRIAVDSVTNTAIATVPVPRCARGTSGVTVNNSAPAPPSSLSPPPALRPVSLDDRHHAGDGDDHDHDAPLSPLHHPAPTSIGFIDPLPPLSALHDHDMDLMMGDSGAGESAMHTAHCHSALVDSFIVGEEQQTSP